MKRILLVAATTGYQTRRFADAIQRLGHELVLATDRCHVMNDPWGDRALAVKFDHPAESAAVLDQTAGPLDAVIALADRPTLVAAELAALRNLPYNPPAAVRAAADKHLAKQAWRSAGLLLPAFVRQPLQQPSTEFITFPSVLKPLHLSASRGVIRADNATEFNTAFQRIRAMLDPSEQYLQVEEYIPGQEFALECVLTRGKLRVLAIFDKPDPLEGPYFEETLYVTPSRAPDSVQDELSAATARAVAALGLTDGPVHAEARWNERGVWMLEAAARPIGGLCAESLRFGPERMPLEELLIRHAIGEDVTTLTREADASGVMMIPIPRGGTYQSVAGEEAARAVQSITDVIITAKPGQSLVPLPEGASYLGFLFARARTPEQVESALRQAHALLQFTIQASLPVLSQAADTRYRHAPKAKRPADV